MTWSGNIVKAKNYREAAREVSRVARECREGKHGDDWTNRDVRDAILMAAETLEELADEFEHEE